jgi:hypothetical protein
VFWDANNKIWGKSCKFDYHLLFNNTYYLPVLLTETKCPNQVFYVLLVDLQTICATYGRETWFSTNDDIRKCLLDMKNVSTKNAFWGFNDKDWRKWCDFVSPFLFNNTYGLPVVTKETKCPNQVFYDWAVLNRAWKRDPLQIMIFVYVCSTWSMVEIKTCFETWITRYDVNAACFFTLLI